MVLEKRPERSAGGRQSSHSRDVPRVQGATKNPRTSGFGGRYIVVADEDRTVAAFVIETSLTDGHAVFQAYDGLSAVELALNLKVCDLVISNTRVGGVAGLDLIRELRARLPKLAILYLANRGRSTPALERRLPHDVPILSVPFTADQLLGTVRALLPRRKAG